MRLLDQPPASADQLRVACIQLAAGPDPVANLRRATIGIREAAARGARVLLLPEKWSLLGESDVLSAGAEPIDGPAITAVQSLCAELDVWCIAGSVALREGARSKLANASLVIGPDGVIRARYDKIHMFDVEVAGVAYRESDAEQPGTCAVVADVAGVTVGLSVCYDLRFPELYRALALAGARVLTVPAAFTERTGRDHWEVLLRARAIENQCFVLAADIIGDHGGGKVSYGRSMIIDPWGIVLAQAADAECVIVADIDMGQLDEVRRRIPSLASRVPEAYAVTGSSSGVPTRTPSNT